MRVNDIDRQLDRQEVTERLCESALGQILSDEKARNIDEPLSQNTGEPQSVCCVDLEVASRVYRLFAVRFREMPISVPGRIEKAHAVMVDQIGRTTRVTVFGKIFRCSAYHIAIAGQTTNDETRVRHG